MPGIFLSYSHRDKRFVERLAGDLKTSGSEVWLDLWEIKPGDSIIGAIEGGLRRSAYVVAVLSPSFVRSRFAREELTASLMRQFKRRQIKVIPALLRKCRIPLLMAGRRYADFSKSYAFGLAELLKSLGMSSGPRGQTVIRDIVRLSFPGRGEIACFKFHRTFELDKPTDTLTDEYVYSEKLPKNICVNGGSVHVEEWAGRYRIFSVFSRPLPANKLIRRIISYELHGVYGDREDFFFYNMNSSFEYARVAIRFSQKRSCTEFAARFMVDGAQPDRPNIKRTKHKNFVEYSTTLGPEVAKFRTVLFEWSW